MVALAVAGILAAIAYPAYTKQMQRGRRADAVSVLTAVMQAQERYRGNNNSYASQLGDLGTDFETSLAKIAPYYQVSLAGVGANPGFATGYTATATVVSTSPQAADLACKTLSVKMQGAMPTYSSQGDPNNTGTNVDTTSQCWPR